MEEYILMNFEEKDIRGHIDESGEPWLVAVDVMEALGIKDQAEAFRTLDYEDRGRIRLHVDEGIRDFATVNSSGLYSLILRFSPALSKKFKKGATYEIVSLIQENRVYH